MTDQRQDEIPGLRSLPRETTPNAELEGRVVNELRAQGLLRAPASRLVRWPIAAAAAMLLLATGWFAREFSIAPRHVAPAPSPTIAAGPRYLLLLRSGSMPEPSAEIEAERVREYTAWGRDLRARGQFLIAAKLDDAAQLLSGSSVAAATLSSRPNEGGHGPVQGFFLITAPTLDEAVRIARTCPHLRHGGVVELRPIATT